MDVGRILAVEWDLNSAGNGMGFRGAWNSAREGDGNGKNRRAGRVG